MKIIINPIFKFIFWVFAFVFGGIVFILHLIYDPKDAIRVKRSSATRHYPTTQEGFKEPEEKWKIDWVASVLDPFFWAPFMDA